MSTVAKEPIAVVAPDSEVLSAEPYAEERRMVERMFESEPWKRFEAIEKELEDLPQISLQLNHVFTPGLYVREILLRKGTLLTTRIHLTEHPFILSSGAVSVWDEANGCQYFQAPYTGITKPGTRRIIFAHEDTVWSTAHPTDKTDPDEIMFDITYSEGKFAVLGGAAADPQSRLLKEPAA